MWYLVRWSATGRLSGFQIDDQYDEWPSQFVSESDAIKPVQGNPLYEAGFIQAVEIRRKPQKGGGEFPVTQE